MDSPPSTEQEAPADPSAELSDTPTGEAPGRSSNDIEVENGQRTVDKDSGRKATDESSAKLTSDHQSLSVTTDKNTATPTGETPVASFDDGVREGADSDEGSKVPADQQGNDGSRFNSSNSERSTDKNAATPTREAPGRSSDDGESERGGADSDEGNKVPAGQKAKDESQDNSSSSEKLTGDHQSLTVTTVKSEEVDHTPEKDKIIDNQADDKRQSFKGNPSEIEKPVDTTPDECSTQNLLTTSPVSQKECANEEIEKPKKKMSKTEDVELIGPTATKTEPAGDTGILGGGIKLLVGVAIVALVAIVAQCYLQSESQPQKTDWQQVDVFLKQMKNVKAKFPNQRTELWSRSEIHLKRHLQTSQPTEPVSLILTSGVRAERTMRCLAQGVASAFSTARNASVLHIDGAGKAGQDSDQVKLDIDRKLQGAFEGDKPVAVIHRLEELPPGSTLIFYRYCDHENAAYKKTFLIFTVVLGNEEEIPAEMRLNIVEEMVDDYLQKKFLSHGHPVSFDRMDLNKYGGLWSRISHLILPVAAEDRIEHEGC